MFDLEGRGVKGVSLSFAGESGTVSGILVLQTEISTLFLSIFVYNDSKCSVTIHITLIHNMKVVK